MLLGLALSTAACTGTIGATPFEQDVLQPDGGGPGPDGQPPPTPLPVSIPATSRAPRLTHAQWENTARDLLKLPANSALSSTFAPDTLAGTFGNNGTSLQVGQQLWTDYQTAAETLASRVARDSAALARIMPPGAPAEPRARARAFVEHVGLRAYRRPLTAPEIDSYLTALYDRGAALLGGDAFVSGVELVLRAMLQSPHFLYRFETSTEAREARIPLNNYEIATRLSYALHNTMPDEALFAAAAAGELTRPDTLITQVRRLLADDRAKSTVRTFHGQLYEWDHFQDVRRDPARFAQYTPTFNASMLREAELFVDEVIYQERRGLTRLLTADFTFANDDLARVYSLPGSFDRTHRRVNLNPTQRRGMLTQTGFLASRAYAVDPDPIHRGVAVNLRLLCATLPNPPANVPAVPPVAAGSTNRQTVNAHTGPGTCGAACHATLINPVGFAFESYDSVGAFRTTDRGMAIDSAGEYQLDGVDVTFDNIVTFATQMSASQQAHACYARYWLEFLAGRGPQLEDAALLRALGERSRADLPVLELIEQVLTSPTMTARSTVEVMP